MRLHRSFGVPGYGKPPEQRSVPELLGAGVINLDKPKGPSSHQVVAWMRQLLGVEKAGHLGTLDPGVTGVLLIGLGRGVRGLEALLSAPKEYICLMHLHAAVPNHALEDIFALFRGKIYQTPPVRSSVRRVRRVREVYELEILEIERRAVLFRTRCESGTYVRTLCTDIGDALGVGANMRELRRTASGGFTERDAHSFQEVEDAWLSWKEEGVEEGLRKVVLPIEALFPHLQKVVVKDSAVDAICHGASLAVGGVNSADAAVARAKDVAIFTLSGEVVALGTALMDAKEMVSAEDGIAVRVLRVLMPPGRYPRMWKGRK
ncbi:MAG: RNA-guided pseudouridylation complex pseudouridine synthase subunit Cbf5 [Candidatus Thermoplasmatota archaeon]